MELWSCGSTSPYAGSEVLNDCNYQHSGWRCQQGRLQPEGLPHAPMHLPCPRCATAEFLQLAWQRACRVNASCDCYSCMPRSGLGTAGFKMAVNEALQVNAPVARQWLQNAKLDQSLGLQLTA